MALLLLTLVVAVALEPSSVAAGGRGARTGSRKEAISMQDGALFFPSPVQDQEEDSTGTKSITSTLMPTGAASHESSFTPEAYKSDWGPKSGPTPPHGGVGAKQNSFMPEEYRKWYPKSDSTPVHGGVADKQDSSTLEAYWVWSPKSSPTPPHGGVPARQNSFTPDAYWVWSPKSGPASPYGGQNSFTPEAYMWVPKNCFTPPHTYVAETTTLATGHDDDLHVATGMLFTRKSMVPGAILPEGTKFAGNGFPDPQRFVSREDADAIPFSYKQVDTILRTFGIPRGSKKADQVGATLRACEAECSESHTCATSEQAELDFAASALATIASELRTVVTVVHGKEDAARYTVAPDGVARIGKAGGGAMVPCHLMAYPYLVHYCHRTVEVEAIRVELMGLGDDHTATTSAIALCHANTTSWDPRYFQMVNATRGEEMCHFMPRNYVLWLPAAAL